MKQDLLKAFRLIKDYCGGTENCNECDIRKECAEVRQKHEPPYRWELEEEE